MYHIFQNKQHLRDISCSILIVEGLAAQGLGVAVSAGTPNEKVAIALAPAITVILILFGGFYVNSSTVPVWLRWYVVGKKTTSPRSYVIDRFLLCRLVDTT